MLAFGPIPSRRLGQSLGINNIPAKHCSFDCVYCQVGRTSDKTVVRRSFFDPGAILRDVRSKVEQTLNAGGRIDYLTIVPDGEPTLDIHLGELIDLLRPVGYKVAVITNGSLIHLQDVRNELLRADCVSIKVDAVSEDPWRKINRPAPEVRLPDMLDGAKRFAEDFKGELITETMLIDGVNDSTADLVETAAYLATLKPRVAYIGIPTRPTAEPLAKAPGEARLLEAHQVFSASGLSAEVLIGYSPVLFITSPDAVQHILDITAVHPMRESEVSDVLARGNQSPGVLHQLVEAGELVRLEHAGLVFYMRRFPKVEKAKAPH
jgi:wyosine [tRNA(Phe)-imidazoG37] synthetase (radical SAM superfamily)